jgi:hypothetical protein
MPVNIVSAVCEPEALSSGLFDWRERVLEALMCFPSVVSGKSKSAHAAAHRVAGNWLTWGQGLR